MPDFAHYMVFSQIASLDNVQTLPSLSAKFERFVLHRSMKINIKNKENSTVRNQRVQKKNAHFLICKVDTSTIY